MKCISCEAVPLRQRYFLCKKNIKITPEGRHHFLQSTVNVARKVLETISYQCGNMVRGHCEHGCKLTGPRRSCRGWKLRVPRSPSWRSKGDSQFYILIIVHHPCIIYITSITINLSNRPFIILNYFSRLFPAHFQCPHLPSSLIFSSFFFLHFSHLHWWFIQLTFFKDLFFSFPPFYQPATPLKAGHFPSLPPSPHHHPSSFSASFLPLNQSLSFLLPSQPTPAPGLPPHCSSSVCRPPSS